MVAPCTWKMYVGELRQAASVAAERHLKQEPPFKDRGDILAAPMQLNPDCGAYSKQRFNSTLSEARSRLAALDTQLRSSQPGEKHAGGSSPVRESDDISDATSTGGSTKAGISSTAAADSGADLENTRTAQDIIKEQQRTRPGLNLEAWRITTAATTRWRGQTTRGHSSKRVAAPPAASSGRVKSSSPARQCARVSQRTPRWRPKPRQTRREPSTSRLLQLRAHAS